MGSHRWTSGRGGGADGPRGRGAEGAEVAGGHVESLHSTTGILQQEKWGKQQRNPKTKKPKTQGVRASHYNEFWNVSIIWAAGLMQWEKEEKKKKERERKKKKKKRKKAGRSIWQRWSWEPVQWLYKKNRNNVHLKAGQMQCWKGKSKKKMRKRRKSKKIQTQLGKCRAQCKEECVNRNKKKNRIPEKRNSLGWVSL